MNIREIERALSSEPVPPPPAHLAERIKQEIPEDLEGPTSCLDDEIGQRRRPRQLWYAAAAMVTLCLTAGVTWQLRHSRPSERYFDEGQRIVVQPRPEVSQTPLPAVEAADSDERGRPLGGESVGAAEPPPVLAEEAVAEIVDSTEVEPVEAPAVQEHPGPGPVTRTTGRIAGRITAADGGTLPGVTVTVKDPSTGLKRTEITDQDGNVAFDDMPEGRYQIDARLVGFRPFAIDARVEADRQSDISGEMGMETFADEIAVVAEAPIVDLRQVNSSVAYDQEYLSAGARSAAPPAAARPRPAPTPAPREKLGSLGYFAEAIEVAPSATGPATGGTAEPNDQPYGDVFFEGHGTNPFIDTEDDHLSTFGLDVDTGSYTVTRRYLRDGNLPPREAVRVEEFVNFFDYRDERPDRNDFALSAEGAPTPFGEGERYRVLRFAINAREVDRDARPPAVLIFVVDVSGSMDRENRLGLVKKALFELLGELRTDDRVGLVIYGSRGEVLLQPTTDHETIRTAIDRLQAGGSTNAEEGLVLAYELAREHAAEDRINRVILCSDGVANVGRTGPESILERVRANTDRGIELTTVGFGMGNYNDTLMEQLADAGDGRYAYVDVLPEARRIFVDELTGTLLTLGHEAKAQVDFNPKAVARYRLLGYENRDIADERFRDPTVDAGEIGSGHTVTALYEVKLFPSARSWSTLATLRFRYRPMRQSEVVEMERRIQVGDLAASWHEAPAALRLATLVAEFAEILKGTYWARQGDMDDVLRRAQKLSPAFAGDGRVAEWVGLVAGAVDLQKE